jgi:3-methyladenine DNA glycosylase AlkD
MLTKLKKELRSFANKKDATHNQKFFKTEKGEYGEGDKFIGVRVPQTRKLAKKYKELSHTSVKTLMNSKIHEERLLGLIILTIKYRDAEKVGNELELKKIYHLYCASFNKINNWDLVDVTCPHIVGKYLHNKDRKILVRWAHSDHLWTRRIAMVSNWWFIRNGDLNSVFKIAKILLQDEHDLIHKAVGWMLREAGKKDMIKTEIFMRKYYKKMPRTMLRYAIERYPESKRLRYLKGHA